jgi:hypothetical protein
MVTMTVSIYADDSSYSDAITCTESNGELAALKGELDEVIISMLKANEKESGDYVVEVEFEEDGCYLDRDDEMYCHCDIDNGTVTWKGDY